MRRVMQKFVRNAECSVAGADAAVADQLHDAIEDPDFDYLVSIKGGPRHDVQIREIDVRLKSHCTVEPNSELLKLDVWFRHRKDAKLLAKLVATHTSSVKSRSPRASVSSNHRSRSSRRSHANPVLPDSGSPSSWTLPKALVIMRAPASDHIQLCHPVCQVDHLPTFDRLEV
jgi:hypothetical protein